MNIGPTILKPQPWGDGYEEYGASQAMVDGSDNVLPPPRLTIELDPRTFEALEKYASSQNPRSVSFDTIELWQQRNLYSGRLGCRASECEPLLLLNTGTVDIIVQLHLASHHTRLHFDRWWLAGSLPLTFTCSRTNRYLHSRLDGCPAMLKMYNCRIYGPSHYRAQVEIETCGMVIDIAHRRRNELRRMGVDVSKRTVHFSTVMSPADALWPSFSSMSIDVRSFLDTANRSQFSLLDAEPNIRTTRTWPFEPTENELYCHRRYEEAGIDIEEEFEPPNGSVSERWSRTALRRPVSLSGVDAEARGVAQKTLDAGPSQWVNPLFDDVGERLQHKGDRLRGTKLRALQAFGAVQLRSDDFGDAWSVRGPGLLARFVKKAASLKISVQYGSKNADDYSNYWPWSEGANLRVDYLRELSSHYVQCTAIRSLVESLGGTVSLSTLREYAEASRQWLDGGQSRFPDRDVWEELVAKAAKDARGLGGGVGRFDRSNVPLDLQSYARHLQLADPAASAALDAVSVELVLWWGLGGAQSQESFAFLYRLLARVPSFTLIDARKYASELRSAVAAKSAEGANSLNKYLDVLCSSLQKYQRLQATLSGGPADRRKWFEEFVKALDAPRGDAGARDVERAWQLSPSADGLPMTREALRPDPEGCTRLDPDVWLQEELSLPTRETLLEVLLASPEELSGCGGWEDVFWLAISRETDKALALANEAERRATEEYWSRMN